MSLSNYSYTAYTSINLLFSLEEDIGDLDRVKKANLHFVTNIIKVLRTDHEYLYNINFTEMLKNIIGIFNDLKVVSDRRKKLAC